VSGDIRVSERVSAMYAFELCACARAYSCTCESRARDLGVSASKERRECARFKNVYKSVARVRVRVRVRVCVGVGVGVSVRKCESIVRANGGHGSSLGRWG